MEFEIAERLKAIEARLDALEGKPAEPEATGEETHDDNAGPDNAEPSAEPPASPSPFAF